MQDIQYTLITELRHKLHQIAETAGSEEKTSALIADFFSDFSDWKINRGIGGHGIVAVYNGIQAGDTILFRAEMDALPQPDKSGKHWQSLHSNCAHACGHDGHMAILAGLAASIQEYKPTNGTIILLFQPAEENGSGAALCVQHPIFQQYPPDFVFALHNIPGKKIGQILIKEGAFSASVKSAIIRLQGVMAHASEPEMGINPSFYAADLIQFCKDFEKSKINTSDFFQITPTYIKIGTKSHGTAAADGLIHLTFRAWNEASMERNMQAVLLQLSLLAKEYKVRTSVKFTDIFPATHNHPAAVARIKDAAISQNIEITDLSEAFRWGEDFGVLTSKFRGALFGLGAGINCPPLHSENYDFPDELIPTAIGLLREMC